MPDAIVVRGAREHNLRSVNVTIPRGRLTVITGLSGSGKSSLAFDTIYAEGQRRYVESLSAYARQHLPQMSRPDVDSVTGLSPAISIEPRGPSRNPRSTVGTITEIYDYLRLLFSRIGEPFCYQCGDPIERQTPPQMVDRVLSLPDRARVSVLGPVVRGARGDFAKLLEDLRLQGFVRVSIDGEIHDLGEPIELDPDVEHVIDVYIDRLVVRTGVRSRLADSVETALRLCDGVVKIAVVEGDDLIFTERFTCLRCGIGYPDLTPRLFSFNSPHGACPRCRGLGALPFVDPDLLVPEPERSLEKGAVEPWGAKPPAAVAQLLAALAGHYGFELKTPWRDLPEVVRRVILSGSGTDEVSFDYVRRGKRFLYARVVEGLVPSLERRYRETDSDQVREDLEQYIRHRSCDLCEGTRLRRECHFIRVGERSLVEVARYSIEDAERFFTDLHLDQRQKQIAGPIVKEIAARLSFLKNVGLDYLTMDRPSGTLSGGEAQRIRLATQIGSALVGVIYVLDEPSSGLHPRDNSRLLETLLGLRDVGNTVIVVEHDEETIRAADHIIDMGPGPGVHGGRVVAEGSLERILAEPASLTGQYLAGLREIPLPRARRTPSRGFVSLEGARGHNLKDISVRVPLGLFTCVTGVSGSGKSSLVTDTLARALAQRLQRSREEPLAHDSLAGYEELERVVEIDQSPIGRTPRSNPATYTGVFASIRELFAGVPESRARGYTAARYTFNTKGGRCEACQGDGVLRIEMHFLPDVFVGCDECEGRRYDRETLEIRYRGLNIAEVLDLSVDEALEIFVNHKKIRPRLETLSAVGLGYLRLGQSATTLSGGEAQRVKLSRELSRRGSGRILYILDEPTTGLHFEDIRRLLEILHRLVEGGHTVLVIEHHLDVIKTADHVIDLGPEGGDAGGEVVACGAPEEVARAERSFTGQFLARVLGGTGVRLPRRAP